MKFNQKDYRFIHLSPPPWAFLHVLSLHSTNQPIASLLSNFKPLSSQPSAVI